MTGGPTPERVVTTAGCVTGKMPLLRRGTVVAMPAETDTGVRTSSTPRPYDERYAEGSGAKQRRKMEASTPTKKQAVS